VIQRYDPAADSWSERARLSMRRDHVAAVALAAKIYVLGGRPGPGDVYKSVEIYDPATDRLEPGPDMLEGRSGFGAGVVDGKIYVAGGEVLIQPFFVRDTVEVLDPTSGTWSFKAKLAMPLHGTGAAAFRGKLYLFGGVANPATSTPRMGNVNVLTP
jgi:N-acetylneuraminic acid mutarotase